MPIKKECPECAIIMSFKEEEGLYICLDPECGYTEYLEEEEQEEDEEVEEKKCPHCGEVINEE